MAVDLDYGLEGFQANLTNLLGHAGENEGKYTAIKGDDVIGPLPDYETALKAAYDRFGIGGFLVKKIERVESVLHFTRDLR